MSLLVLSTWSAAQLGELYQSMYMVPVAHDIVLASIRDACGAGILSVPKEKLVFVLQNIHDRKVLEESAYWDFHALVLNTSQTLTPQNALLFFRVQHGERFSTDHWLSFQASRIDPLADISWSEIRPWICSVPQCGDADSNAYLLATKAVSQQMECKQRKFLDSFDERTRIQSAKSVFDYTEITKNKAKANLVRWETKGLSSFLLEDGSMELGPYNRISDDVSAADILDSIDKKYQSLRRKLLSLMACEFYGQKTWEIMSEFEQHDLIDEMSIEERRLRSKNLLLEKIVDLPGSDVSSTHQFGSLAALMDTFGSGSEGRDDPDNKLKDYWSILADVKDTYGSHLLDLNHRCLSENALFMGKKRVKQSKVKVIQYYCRLLQQQLIIDKSASFSDCAIATGLAERSSLDSHKTIDKIRYEFVAQALLNPPTSPPLPAHQIQVSATKDLKTAELLQKGRIGLMALIIAEVDRQQDAEKQVLMKMITQLISLSTKTPQSTMAKEEVIKRLTMLSNQRESWREGTAEVKQIQRKMHAKLLHEALVIYLSSEDEIHQTNDNQLAYRAITVALLRKQGQEFDKIIEEISSMQKTELVDILRREENKTRFEYCDNIAAVLFASVECTEDDKLYVRTLLLKYDELRLQLMQFALAAKLGDSWYSRTVDDQQRQLARMAADLKELQEHGRTSECDAVLGNAVLEISVWQLMGENRLEFDRRMKSADHLGTERMPAELDVIASFTKRYYAEYASVLEMAHQETGNEVKVLLAQLNAEIMVARTSGDFRIACYSTALLERISAVLEGRHNEDLIRLENLAKCLVTSYQHRITLNQPYFKIMSDHSADNNSSGTIWFESLLKEVLLRHADEREMLLSVLMDESLHELIEVAELMTRDQKQQRLVDIQNKLRWLEINGLYHDKSLELLEEAAAISQSMMANPTADEHLDGMEVIVRLLYNLLCTQEKELALLIKSCASLDKTELMKFHSEEVDCRRWSVYKNVVSVLTAYNGLWTDHLILDQLRLKHEAIQFALLEQFLRTTRSDWSLLSEAEKQPIILKLREELTSDAQGVKSEVKNIPSVLRQLLPIDQTFYDVFGENCFEFSHKVMAFQSAKKMGKNLLYCIEEQPIKIENALLGLSDRWEEEKQFIQNLLKGIYEVFLGEKGRMAETLRLRYHASCACLNGRWSELAHYISLSERAQVVTYINRASNTPRVMSVGDWERLLSLAKHFVDTPEALPEIRFSDIAHTEGANDLMRHMENILETVLKRQHTEIQTLKNVLHSVPSVASPDSMVHLPYDRKLQYLRQIQSSRDLSVEWAVEELTVLAAVKLKALEEYDSEQQSTTCLMAELLERHLFELADLIRHFGLMGEDDTRKLQAKLLREITPELLSALTDTSHLEKSIAEQISDAVEYKYEAFKEKIFYAALVHKFGENYWARAARAEQQQLLFDLKVKAAQDGQQDPTELTSFLGSETEISGTLELFLGKGCVLPNLVNVCKMEAALVMKEIESYQTVDDMDHKAEQKLSKIRRHQRRIREEKDLSASALLCKIWSGPLGANDRDVQEKLARARVLARETAGKEDRADGGRQSLLTHLPATDDLVLLRDTLSVQTDSKHAEEREQLLIFIEKSTTCEYQQTWAGADNFDLVLRLDALSELRRQLIEAAHFEAEDHMALLLEATCIKTKLKAQILETSKKVVNITDLKTSLLADLQQQQDREAEAIEADLDNKIAKSLKQIISVQQTARQLPLLDNVAAVLMSAEEFSAQDGCSKNSEMLGALESKYDALKDKLILESLMNQLGVAEWAQLSDKEKQKKLLEIKMKEKRLLRSGKVTEARQLINNLLEADKSLERVKADQDRMLRERAEKLRERLAERPNNAEQLQQELNRVEESLKRTSILDRLQFDLESEKQRLLNLLQSTDDEEDAHRLRQMEAAKLRRQQHLLKRDMAIDEASAIIFLAKQQEEDRLAGLSSDKEMQMELARRRLSARNRRIREQHTVTQSQIISMHQVSLMDQVLEAVDRKHQNECKFFDSLLSDLEQDEDAKDAAQFTNTVKLRKALEEFERTCRTYQVKAKEAGWEDCDRLASDMQAVLSKSLLYNFIAVVKSNQEKYGSEITFGELHEAGVKVLSTLLEKEKAELDQINGVLLTADELQMSKLIEIYDKMSLSGIFDNVIAAIFSVLDDEKVWSTKEVIDKMNDVYEQQKQELMEQINAGNNYIEKDGKGFDARELLQKLIADHDAQERALMIQMDKQQEMMMARRKARKSAQLTEDHNMALHLLKTAQESDLLHREISELDKRTQSDMMKDRLARRREERAHKANLEDSSTPDLLASGHQSTVELMGAGAHLLPPGLGLKRERTVVHVSEEQAREQLKKVLGHSDKAQRFLSDQQREQDQLIRKKRLEKEHKNESEAAKILTRSEEEKQLLAKLRSDEENRQITLVKDRIAKIQHEKTLTLKSQRKKAVQFESLINTGQNLSKDEQMQLLAENMQKQFSSQAQDLQQGKKTLGASDLAEAKKSFRSAVLSTEMKQHLLNERRLARKQKMAETATTSVPQIQQPMETTDPTSY